MTTTSTEGLTTRESELRPGRSDPSDRADPSGRDDRSERVNALVRAARQQVEGAVAVLRVADDLHVDTRELHERTRVLCADARRRIIEARELLCADDAADPRRQPDGPPPVH